MKVPKTNGYIHVRMLMMFLLAATLIAVSKPLYAQSDNARDARIRALEAQQQNLQDEIANLKSSGAKTTQDLTDWKDVVAKWAKKFSIGTTVYGDWAMFTHTGYGPQPNENIFPPGPGNNLYNSFDLTRAYLDLKFMPTKDFTLRVTPDLYRAIGDAGDVNNSKNSKIGTNLSGNLGMRIKYAYLSWNTPFSLLGIKPMAKDAIIFGQQGNSFIPWEEDLSGMRYVYLVPWNYLGLSSSQTGISVGGPIEFGEGEARKQYITYNFGVFTNASFRALELTNTKQIMERVSIFPFGSKDGYAGLGATEFMDYGWTNASPDNTCCGKESTHVMRTAALLHYKWNSTGLWSSGMFAVEGDYGRNAFTASNLFSGSGPLSRNSLSGLASLIQGSAQSRQIGYDAFGSYQIPGTPLSIFGLYQQLWPNAQVSENPFDLRRFIVGIQWKINDYLRLSVSNQNLLFYHDQFKFPKAELIGFDPKVKGGVSHAVPRDTHAFFVNLEFSYKNVFDLL